jgi:GT2 family glycosyltransferase
MLIERRAFDRVGGFDPTLMVGEMFDWVGRAERAGIAFIFIDDVVLRRRIHGSNTVLRLKERQTDYLRAIRASIAHGRKPKPETGQTP